MKKTVTVTGIRPDFIRMSALFKKLDQADWCDHILIHTGQHYDKMLSDVFFDELKIRKPDYNLCIGAGDKKHYHQTADLSVKIIELLKKENIKPDIILFLGDSNSVVASVPLKKEGYKIGHIEAGMRSYDRRMLEEINRTVCDHCSDLLFTYHENYRLNLLRENIPSEGIFVVGNTIVEVCKSLAEDLFKQKKQHEQILLDIHRPENFKYKNRMKNIIEFANSCIDWFKIPVRMIKFNRTLKYLEEYDIDLGRVELVELMSYKKFLEEQYHSMCMISDSGTAQEEPALLGTPVVVPRNYTERSESISNNCSCMIDMDKEDKADWDSSLWWVNRFVHGSVFCDVEWLGDGKTSDRIIQILKNNL